MRGSERLFPFVVLLSIILPGSLVKAQRIAAVGSPIPNPVYVNIYWDWNWDADNPSGTMSKIDDFTSAVISSAYFSGLAEYGVTAPTFNSRSFIADPRCGNNGVSPSRVALFDVLGGPALQTFINCEVDNGDVPAGTNFIYNVFLAPSTIESDIYGLLNSCTGYAAYHFHGNMFGGPIFTAIFPACTPSFGALMTSLAHEMVEAATDPFPSLSAIISGGEIADFCVGTGWAPPRLAPVSWYWSNATQKCVTGFGPFEALVPAPTLTAHGWGSSMSLTIGGSDLGALPLVMDFRSNVGSVITLPAQSNLPYLTILDRTQNWEGGNALNKDVVIPNVMSWSPAGIQISGFLNPAYSGNWQVLPGDALKVEVCNPSSLLCWDTGTTLPLAPVATSLSPASGPVGGGYPVTINGKDFGSTPQVLFGAGVSVPPLSVSPDGSRITVTAPLGDPGAVDVQVTNPSLSTTAGPPATFSYCGPRVGSVSPASGAPGGGTAVTIAGDCFAGATSVRFGSAGTLPATVTGNTIAVTTPPVTPANCVTVDVQVLTPDRDGVAESPLSARDRFLYGDPTACATGGGTACSGANPPDWCRDPDPCSRPNPPRICNRDYARVPRFLRIAPTDLALRRFDDLPADTATAAAIQKLVNLGVLPGITPQRFAPRQWVTRSEFAAALVRAIELPVLPPPREQPVAFTDVEVGQLDYPFFRRAQPYMTTYRDQRGLYAFHETLPVERQEAAQSAVRLLVAARKLRALDSTAVKAVLAGITDRDRVARVFETAVATAIRNELIAADSTGAFRPTGFLTRAELASLIVRLQHDLAAPQPPR